MRLARELSRRGHKTSILTRAPAEPHPEARDIPVLSVPGDTPVQIAHAIARLIDRASYDDVVIQYTARMWGTGRFGSAALPMLAANCRRRGFRVALIAHELFTPWSWRLDLAAGSMTLRLQLGAVMSACDVVFATTETRRTSVASALAALKSPPRLGVLRVGSNATPIGQTSGLGRPRCGLFSTLAVGKRFDVAISAFETIWRKRPDAELIIIGDLGPNTSPSVRTLKSQIDASPARARVHLTGKVPLSEVASIVSTLGIYLFPMDTGANSRSSTLPIAFASGVPVVAVRGIETDPLFEDRSNVLFADMLDGESFGHAGLNLLDDRVLSETLSKGARSLFDRHLSWERIGDAFLEALP